MKVRAAHLRWKLQAGLWDLKYQPGKDLIADVGTKALPIARMKEMRERMSMGWQPDSVDAVHEEDQGIVAPRAMRLVAKYHLEKATRLVVVLSLLQTVHGSLQGNETGKEGDEVVDGDIYLGVFALIWS